MTLEEDRGAEAQCGAGRDRVFTAEVGASLHGCEGVSFDGYGVADERQTLRLFPAPAHDSGTIVRGRVRCDAEQTRPEPGLTVRVVFSLRVDQRESTELELRLRAPAPPS